MLSQKNTFSRQLSMLSLARTRSKRNIWELLKTSSKWWAPLHQSVILFQEDNAWLNVSSFWSSTMTFLSTSSPSDHISLMMMTSTGISVLLPQLPKSSKKLKKPFYKFTTKSISKTISTSLGSADATSWTLNLISHGKSISIWKHQMSHFNC